MAFTSQDLGNVNVPPRERSLSFRYSLSSNFSTRPGGWPITRTVDAWLSRADAVWRGWDEKTIVFAQRCVAPWDIAVRIPSSESGKHHPSSLFGDGVGSGVIIFTPFERSV